jgi:hypothetical protein
MQYAKTPTMGSWAPITRGVVRSTAPALVVDGGRPPFPRYFVAEILSSGEQDDPLARMKAGRDGIHRCRNDAGLGADICILINLRYRRWDGTAFWSGGTNAGSGA